jgi:hypothetical protein
VPRVDTRGIDEIILMPVAAEHVHYIMRRLVRSVVDTEFIHFEAVLLAIVPRAHDMLCAAVVKIDYLFLDDGVSGIARHDPIHSLSA